MNMAIEALEVEPEFQGRGIAKALMQKALSYCRSTGDKQVYLNASPMGNKGMELGNLVAFYQKFGFKVIHKGGPHNTEMLLTFGSLPKKSRKPHTSLDGSQPWEFQTAGRDTRAPERASADDGPDEDTALTTMGIQPQDMRMWSTMPDPRLVQPSLSYTHACGARLRPRS
jgi:hypothetical protein